MNTSEVAPMSDAEVKQAIANIRADRMSDHGARPAAIDGYSTDELINKVALSSGAGTVGYGLIPLLKTRSRWKRLRATSRGSAWITCIRRDILPSSIMPIITEKPNGGTVPRRSLRSSALKNRAIWNNWPLS